MAKRLYLLIVAVFTCAASGPALAQTGAALLLKPLLSEEEMLELRGDALFLNNGSTDNGGADFQLSVYEASGRFREQRERLVPRLGFDITYLDLDTKDPVLPDQLTDVSFAAGVELPNVSDFRAGLTVGLGYAGDTPFGEGDAWYGKATLVLGKKLDEKTDLAFVLDYDGNRIELADIPLPGIALRHEFDPKLSYVVGAPLNSVTWKPLDDVTVEATYMLLDRFDASVDYNIVQHVALFGKFETRQEAFHVEGLQGHDRLFFEQRRAELGIRLEPRELTRFTAAIGYAFSGEFSSGWSIRDTDAVADISDEPYFRLGFETRF